MSRKGSKSSRAGLVALAATSGVVGGVLGVAARVSADVNAPSGCEPNGYGTNPDSFSPFGIGQSHNCYLANDSVNYDRSGDYEVEVQRVLTDIGDSTSGIDGIYGTNTENAVKAYQKYYGLTQNGITGTYVWGYLHNDAYGSGFCGYAFGFDEYGVGSAPCGRDLDWDPCYNTGSCTVTRFATTSKGGSLVWATVNGPSS